MTDENLPVESDIPTIEEVTAVVLSYTDPNLMVVALESLGWDCTQEIIETLKVAKQSVNLGAKMTAIKYLRTLLLSSAEAVGMIGNVTRSVPGRDGSVTTFSARNMATALNPERKQIIVKEIDNVKQRTEEETVDGGSIGEQSGDECGEIQGGVLDRTPTGEPPCGGSDPGREGNSGASPGGNECGADDTKSGNSAGGAYRQPNSGGVGEGVRGDGREYEQPPREGETDNPCVEHRPPTCDRKLYPGVSGNPSTGGTPDGGKDK